MSGCLIEADVIAVAINQKPENDLIKELALKAEEFYVIGDCSSEIGRAHV